MKIGLMRDRSLKGATMF